MSISPERRKSVSPERRFATSPEHEMLKKVFKKTSLKQYRENQQRKKDLQRMCFLEDQLEGMADELTRTRERVDSISQKLDFIVRHICGDKTQSIFKLDDI